MARAVEVARTYFDLAQTNSPELGDLMADDVSWWVPESSPLGGTHQGREAVFKMLEKAFALYDVSSMRIDLPLAFGDDEWACVRFVLDCKTAKGRDWHGEYAAIFEVRDGKIRSVREYFDTKRLIEVVFD